MGLVLGVGMACSRTGLLGSLGWPLAAVCAFWFMLGFVGALRPASAVPTESKNDGQHADD